jgi:hypothetical protein
MAAVLIDNTREKNLKGMGHQMDGAIFDIY